MVAASESKGDLTGKIDSGKKPAPKILDNREQGKPLFASEPGNLSRQTRIMLPEERRGKVADILT